MSADSQVVSVLLALMPLSFGALLGSGVALWAVETLHLERSPLIFYITIASFRQYHLLKLTAHCRKSTLTFFPSFPNLHGIEIELSLERGRNQRCRWNSFDIVYNNLALQNNAR